MKQKFHVKVKVFKPTGVDFEDFFVNAKSEKTLRMHLGYRYAAVRYDVEQIERVPEAQMSLF